MRFDLSYFAFLEKHEVRILTAVQLGMRNHQWVPIQVIQKLAALPANSFKDVRNLLKMKLLSHTGKKYDGYRLTNLGYDFLAVKALFNKGLIEAIHGKIGVGKESDIYKCTAGEKQLALKVTRLGRVSFRSVKNNRDYIKHRTQYNWLYLSRLSAIKEFEMMKSLYKAGFPTPEPIEQNRHMILMSFIDGTPLYHIRSLNNPIKVFKDCLTMICKFAQNGLIHGDFNEFNLLLEADQNIRVIDFPQAISRQHPEAEKYFCRDVQCVYDFFDRLILKNHLQKEFRTEGFEMLGLSEITVSRRLDRQVRASGSSVESKGTIDFELIEAIRKGHYQQTKQGEEQEDEEQQWQQQEQSQQQQEQTKLDIVQTQKQSKGGEKEKEEEHYQDKDKLLQKKEEKKKEESEEEYIQGQQETDIFQEFRKDKMMYRPLSPPRKQKQQKLCSQHYIKHVQQKERNKKKKQKGKNLHLDLCRNKNKGRTKVQAQDLCFF